MTAEESRDHLADIFAYTATIFDEIVIDDFLYTDCECEDSVASRGDRSWGAYRADRMWEVTREHLLTPFDVAFVAPAGVCLYLFDEPDPRTVVQNNSDERVTATLSVEWSLAERLTVLAATEPSVDRAAGETTVALPPRSLVVL